MLFLALTFADCLLVDFDVGEVSSIVGFDMIFRDVSDFVVPGKNRASKEAITVKDTTVEICMWRSKNNDKKGKLYIN
jgi:hypothetical protein